MRNSLVVVFAFLFLNCAAQFTNVTSSYNFNLEGSTSQSGCGVSFYDYDKDGWDDLTVGQSNNDILVYHNDNGDYNVSFVFPNTGDPKQLTWVDYDNDGDADFFFAISTQSCKLFNNDGTNVFTDVTSSLNLPILNGKSFGACWGDYDNDSFLDVYICNYSTGPNPHTNWLLHNNGDGTFANVTAAMGVGNGVKPSYQSTWIDINLDGLLDLYVVNDFSYVNELYINNGTSFDAAGAAWNLNLAMEGMSISWSDFDYDGDNDVFISNNMDGNKLMRNDAGVMTDIAAEAGVLVNSTCWGSLWMDYDHDGMDDLHVSTSSVSQNGNQNFLFHNNGNYNFGDSSMVNDAQIVFSSAKGDKNNDGYWDFIEMKQYPSTVALYQNNGGNNHWIKVGLTGTVSNRDAIGAVMHYYYDGNSYMLHTFCGEGFLEQDSQYEILSLGDNIVLDSLTVNWPSGWTDHFYDLNADTKYTFVEGETFIQNISNVNGNLLCPESGSVELMVSGGPGYLWSTDEETQSIQVSIPGIYSAIVTNEWGIQTTAFYEVTTYAMPLINQTVVTPSCYGVQDGCITLSATEGEIISVLWNDVEGAASMCSLPANTYDIIVTDGNGCGQNISILMEYPDSLNVTITADTACYESFVSAQIVITGGTGSYSQNWFGELPEALYAGNYILEVQDENNCIASEELFVAEYPQIIFSYTSDTVCFENTVALNYEISGGTPGYSVDWNGADPNMLSSGNYEVTIEDQNACSATANVSLSQSTEIILTATIQNAANGDNGSVEISTTGGIEPYTYLWSDESTANTLSNIGQGTYNVTVSDAADCQAEIEVEIIDILVGENILNIFMSPNPCHNQMRVQLNIPTNIFVHDSFGKLIYSSYATSISHILDTSNWSQGIYILSAANARLKFIRN